jgi:hypothetical protein
MGYGIVKLEVDVICKDWGSASYKHKLLTSTKYIMHSC